MEININLVITFILIFALFITEDNAGIVLKNFKSRRTMMEELEKEAKDEALSTPSSTNITNRLIKSNKVKIKSKVKNLGGNRKLLKNEVLAENKNISVTGQDPKANLKNFPKLQNSSVVYVDDSNRSNEQRKRKPKNLVINANSENLEHKNISNLSQIEDSSLAIKSENKSTGDSSHQHNGQDIGYLSLTEINHLSEIEEDLANKAKDESTKSILKNDQILSPKKDKLTNITSQNSNAFMKKHVENFNFSEEIKKNESFKLENITGLIISDNLDNSFGSQNISLSNHEAISESTVFSSDFHQNTNTSAITETVEEEKILEKEVEELDQSAQNLNESKANNLIQENKETSSADSSATNIPSIFDINEKTQNDTVPKEFSGILVNDKINSSNNEEIEANDLKSSLTEESLISDEFNVKKFMETLKEIVIDDIDQDLQFESVVSGNSTQSEKNSLVDSDILNKLNKISQKERFKMTVNDSIEIETLTSGVIPRDQLVDHSETHVMKNITKENSDLNSEMIGSEVKTFNETFSNQTKIHSESVPSGLDTLMNSEVAKNAIDMFNVSDSSITDHVIEDSDFHSIIDLMLPSLPVLEQQTLSNEKLDLLPFENSSSTNSNETAFEINSSNSVIDVNKKNNESLIVLTEDITATPLESVSNVTNDTSKSKCPPPGICVFWFMARDNCFNDSQCSDSKLCCRIRCSKQCVDVLI